MGAAPDYDIIIVGGGSAGCVLAERLSADGRRRVLLLEAGGDDRKLLVDWPFGFAALVGNPRYDWRLRFEAEAGLAGRRLDCPRGKVLGGSSSINAMLYVRGPAEDYDHWREQGGWAWADLEPYFRRIEDYADVNAAARGHAGPTGVCLNPTWFPCAEALLDAAAQAGIGRSEDYNAQSGGLGRAQLFVRDGRRSGSAAAYLRPARARANLQVITGAHATRIRFEGRRAVGVDYRHGNRSCSAHARAEVILSAGSVGSPKLLECSGVGDARRLQALGIGVIHDLPAVGEHAQDHYLSFVSCRLRPGVPSLHQAAAGGRALWNLVRYAATRSGPFSGSPSALAGHAQTEVNGEAAWLQFIGTVASFTARGGKTTLDASPGVMLGSYLGRPRSRGSVHITTPDIDTQPAIRANFLTDPFDQAMTVAGLRLCRRVFNQPAFAPYLDVETAPGPSPQSDEELLDYARQHGDSAFHLAGSCRMGPNEQSAVVDTQLRVHGLQNLRVVDASVMPSLIAANTHAPVLAIAEKAADLILASGNAG